MRFLETPLKGLFVIELEPLCDERGFFVRAFCDEEFRVTGHKKKIVQINHSMTCAQGSIRGMHYQRPPKAENKIVRCIKGRVFDVAVDLRAGSATFLHWFSLELAAEKMNGLYIPEGFAHGFQTLEDNCELLYLHTECYAPAFEAAVRYDEPMVGIKWPLPVAELSKRDSACSYLNSNFKGIE